MNIVHPNFIATVFTVTLLVSVFSLIISIVET